ncbi:WD40 repeat domain-containing protein [Streptomyces sp. SBT349]|uniref:WD40 repeat domain-containing protein n=1 Tax=Streptomyces sp. SBT349 TaxID=1580539 RepID=UPI00066B191A|nr:WD40 repeat domain-containing protein [Streptomyces sp. SBT349]
MTTVQSLLDSRPGRAGWFRICGLLEGLDQERLDAVTSRVLRWPAAQRPMPDHWWAQWVAGDVRPYHALAGTRRLGRLDNVETGTVPLPVEDDREEGADSESAYFFGGASAVAAPPGLRWAVLAAAAEWHHNGGDIVRWHTTRDAPLVWYLSGGEYYDEAYDIAVSPDGETVVTAVEGAWHAWSARTGEPLWQVRPCLGEEEEDAPFGRDDVVRFAFSGDGERLAVGTGSTDVVTVVEVATGKVLLRVPEGQDAFGPVALDSGGRLLAHAGPAGRVVVREVVTGVLLATAETGLTSVGALAFAPDGDALFAVGGAVGGAPERAGLATAACPAARVVAVHGSEGPVGALTLTPGRMLRPEGFAEGLDADAPSAALTARAIWTQAGPYGFIGADFGSLLFDGEGRTLWADPAAAIAAFTPDGLALVTVQDDIEAWFLAGLAPSPDAGPPPPPEAGPGTVLLDGLPAALAGGPRDAAPLPCSHWSIPVAAVSNGGVALAFGAKLERDSADRPQVLCRWPEPFERPGPSGAGPSVALLPRVPDAAYLADLAFVPGGDAVARALLGEGSCVVLDDAYGGTPRWRHPLPATAPYGEERLRLAFSRDGSRLALALHTAGAVHVLDAATGRTVRIVAEPVAHPDHWRGVRVEAAALDATGARVALGARDAQSRVVVRDVGTGAALVRAEPAGLRQITGLAFAPDGTELAVAGSTDRGHAALWLLPLPEGGEAEADPAAPVKELTERPRLAVPDLPMHDQPDGALVWSATGGPRAYFPGSHGWGAVWEARGGTVVAEIPFGRADGAVALSPDGDTLVTVTQFGARRWPLGS